MIIDPQNPFLLPAGFVSPDWVHGASKVKQPEEITDTIIINGTVDSTANVQGDVDPPNY